MKPIVYVDDLFECYIQYEASGMYRFNRLYLLILKTNYERS